MAMLGRLPKRPPRAGPAFTPSSAFPFDPLHGATPTAAPTDPATGRQRDMTFHDRFLTPARQPTVFESIWQNRVKRNVHKAQIRKLPKREKVQFYVENRSRRQKVLDWVGTRSREVVAMGRTVDAWSGPVAKTSPFAVLQKRDVKVLESGVKRVWFSERMKRGLVWGMLISMGGLVGWLATEKTRMEGPIETADPPKRRKKIAVAPEDEEKRPGVFVWGSNR